MEDRFTFNERLLMKDFAHILQTCFQSDLEESLCRMLLLSTAVTEKDDDIGSGGRQLDC